MCDERPRDGERQVIFVDLRERVEEAEGMKYRKRSLAGTGEVESWEQYRAVNGGTTTPKGRSDGENEAVLLSMVTHLSQNLR